MFNHGKLMVLALGLSMNAMGCDSPSEGALDDGSFRTGHGLGTGASLTLNTNKWVSSAARDVYEFSMHGEWHTNSFDYDIKLDSIEIPLSPYGTVTSPVGPPAPGQTHVQLAGSANFGVEVFGPQPGDPIHELDGGDLVGLQLTFEVKGNGGVPHPVILQIVSHQADPSAGDFYEIKKVDPVTGAFIGPLCEEDSSDQRMAKIYNGLSVDGETGTMDYVGLGMHHIACASSAPGKAIQFGYDPVEVPLEQFKLANRVIRADYCGDGHPYTYPGNLLAIEDNVSAGQEGKTMADVHASLGEDEVLEAVWNPDGVMCVGTPRANTMVREDIVCPTKLFANGTIKYNWRPPNCDGFVDVAPPNALRFYSKSAAL